MKHIWLTNVIDPRKSFSRTALGHPEIDENLWQRWLSAKAIGDPKPSEGASTEQLKEQGYVGVYKLV